MWSRQSNAAQAISFMSCSLTRTSKICREKLKDAVRIRTEKLLNSRKGTMHAL